MPRMHYEGDPVYRARKGTGIGKPSSELPEHPKRYWYEFRGGWVRMQFQPFRGLYAEGFYHRKEGTMVPVQKTFSLWSMSMKKFTMGVDATTKLPPLASASVVWKKYPLLCQFITATSYEDGSPRAPGKVWIENDGIAFVVVLKEPSAFAQVRLRAGVIDDMFSVAEMHLGTENAPWEVDRWALQKHQEATEKKSVAKRKSRG